MNNLNILIVSQYFYPEEFRINDIAKSFIAKGVNLDVLTGQPNYPGGIIYSGYSAWKYKVDDFFGVNLYRIPLFPRGMNSFWRLSLNYLSFIFFGIFLGSFLLRKKKYDVVFVYGISPILMAIPAVFLSWQKKAKLVTWVQDLWPNSLVATGYIKNKFVLYFFEVIVSWIYRHSDLILVQSRAFIPEVKKLAKKTEIDYYPNSVDPIFRLPVKTKFFNSNLSILDKGFSVVFAGNIGRGQAVEVIIQAAKILEKHVEINFVVFGDGSRLEWMKKSVFDLKLSNLHLLGRLPIEIMPSIMQKASVLLVTLANESIYSMTIPNKIQAYLASGRPIIACLNGEGARIVSEAQAGFTVAAEDATALASAVLALYNLPLNELDTMGNNGKKYFKINFDHETLINQLLLRFQELTSK